MNEVRELLLGRVDAMRETLAAQIDDEEQSARLSKTSSDALYDAGILRMKLPEELGGFEADLPTQLEVLESIARINPAAAWCAMAGATSIALPGAFLPFAGIERMFANGVIPRAAVVIMPTGQAERTREGYRLSGRWAFASGIHHAEWICAQAPVLGNGTEPVLHMFVIPASEVEIHDNWQVLGLRGTGSCDISVEDLWVPESCAWAVETQPPRRGGPLYRLGIPAFVAYEHAGFATGVARRALDLLIETARSKKRGYGPAPKSLSDREVLQRFIGRSDLQLRAARAIALERNREAMAVIERGDAIGPQLALQLRGVACYCTEVAAEITTEAFRLSGASSIFESNAMQRCMRDLQVAAQHLMVSERSYELLGQTVLGFRDVDPMG